MKVKEVAFIGYPVTEIQRARDFYERVLGLQVGEFAEEIKSMPGKYWIEYDIGATTLAISNTWEPSGQSGPSVALEVEDLDEAISRMKAAEVKLVSERMDFPTCSFVLITDPDGNAITIHKRNPKR